MRQAVSRTATVVALWRARESLRPASIRLFEDTLAPAFLGWRFRWALHLSRLPVVGAALPWSLIDGHWPGSRGTVVVRTRYIDDALGEALRSGVEQVVILGAGFDSRAYRSPILFRAIFMPEVSFQYPLGGLNGMEANTSRHFGQRFPMSSSPSRMCLERTTEWPLGGGWPAAPARAFARLSVPRSQAFSAISRILRKVSTRRRLPSGIFLMSSSVSATVLP